VVTPSPSPNAGRFGAIEDFTRGPTYSPTELVKPIDATTHLKTNADSGIKTYALRVNQKDDAIVLPETKEKLKLNLMTMNSREKKSLIIRSLLRIWHLKLIKKN
jgi:hypothetical protein